MVNLTDDEYDALAKAADKGSVSAFIRSLVSRYLARRRK